MGPCVSSLVIPRRLALQKRLSLSRISMNRPDGELSIIRVLDSVPIGGVVAEFFVPEGAGFTWSLTSNPGNGFAFSGNQLAVDNVLSLGLVTLGIQATNGVITRTGNFTFDVVSVSRSFVMGATAFPSSIANMPYAEWQPVSQVWPVNMPPAHATHPPFGFENYFATVKFPVNCQPPVTSPVCSFTGPAGWGWPLANFNKLMISSFTGNGDPDNEAIDIDESDGTCLSLDKFTRTSDTTATLETYAQDNIITGNGFGDSLAGRGAGTVASGTSNYLGALVKQEVAKGAINHFLAIALCGTATTTSLINSGPAYTPAISNDGGGPDGFAVEGMLLAIDPNASMPGGLSTEFGAILFNCFKDYGAFVLDGAGSNSLYAASDVADPANSWTGDDLTKIISDFNVLGPMLSKVGCYLDGIENSSGVQFQCGPRQALRRYSGQIASAHLSSSGGGYQAGTYTNVPIGVPKGGIGKGALATIVVGVGLTVTSVTLTSGGQNYSHGDVLSCAPVSIGFFGSGFTYTVDSISSGNSMTVSRDSGGTQNIGFTNGFLDNTSLSSFCTGTTGRVAGYNDSVGNFGPAAPTGTAPIIFQSGALVTMGGKPAMLFDGISNILKVPSSSSIISGIGSDLLYFCATVQVSDRAASYGLIGSDASGGVELRIDITTGFVRLRLNSGTSIGVSATAVALNSPTCIEATYNPTTGAFVIFQNRTQTASGTNLQSLTAGNILIGAGGSAADLFKGLIGDCLIATPASLLSNSQYTINRSAQQYWGTA